MRSVLLALVCLLGLGGGIAVAQPYAPPPPPRYEPPPPPPPPGRMIWRPGHWNWNGVRYVWVPGHYIVRPPVANRWVPGHWARGPYGHWHWVPAHWV